MKFFKLFDEKNRSLHVNFHHKFQKNLKFLFFQIILWNKIGNVMQIIFLGKFFFRQLILYFQRLNWTINSVQMVGKENCHHLFKQKNLVS
jgi:hypothetical protein